MADRETTYRIRLDAQTAQGAQAVIQAFEAIERGAAEALAALRALNQAPGNVQAAQAQAAAAERQAGALRNVAQGAQAAGRASQGAQQPTRALGDAQTRAAEGSAALARGLAQGQAAAGRFVAAAAPAAAAARNVGAAAGAAAAGVTAYSAANAGAASTSLVLQSRLGRLWDTLSRGAVLWQGLLLPLTGFAAAGAAVVGIISGPAGLEESMANVAKVTDLTAVELRALQEEMIGLARRPEMRRSAAGLAELAAAAGQLGIEGSNNLLKFAQTTALLEQTTDLAAEEAAFSLARMLQVTGEAADNVDRLGNAIVGLGNNTAATEAEITRNALRIGQATAAYEFGASRVAAYGATLRELGAQAEISSGVLGRALVEIQTAVNAGGDALERFAAVANLSAQEFVEVWRRSPAEAFEAVLQGLREQGQEAISTLQELGLGGSENLRILPLLAQNYDRLSRNIGIATQAWEENNAAQQEAGRRAETFYSRLAALGSTIAAVAQRTEALLPAFKGALDLINAVIANLAGLPPVIEANTVAVEALSLAFVALAAAAAAAAAQAGGGLFIRLISGTTAARVAVVAFSSVLTGNLSRALLAARIGVAALYTAIRAHPFVAIVTAITAVIYVIQRLAGWVADLEIVFRGRAVRIGDVVRATLAVLADYIRAWLRPVYDFVAGALRGLFDISRAVWRGMWEAVSAFADAILERLASEASIWGTILRAVARFGDAVTATMRGIVAAIRAAIQSLINAAIAVAEIDYTSVTGFVRSIERAQAAAARVGTDSAQAFAEAFTREMERGTVSRMTEGVLRGLRNIATGMAAIADLAPGQFLDLILPESMGRDIAARIRGYEIGRLWAEAGDQVKANFARLQEEIRSRLNIIRQDTDNAAQYVASRLSFAFGPQGLLGAAALSVAEFAALRPEDIPQVGGEPGDEEEQRKREVEAAHRLRMLEVRRLEAEFAEGEAAREAERQAQALRHEGEIAQMREHLLELGVRQAEIEEHAEMAALRRAQAEEALALTHTQALERARELAAQERAAREEMNASLQRTEALARTGGITANEAFTRGREAVARYRAAVEGVRERFAALIEQAEDPRTREALRNALGELTAELPEVTQDLERFSDRVRDNLTAPTEGFFRTLIRTAGDARAALAAFLNDIADMFSRFAARKLGNALLESLFGSEDGGGTGLLGGVTNAAGGFFGGLFGRGRQPSSPEGTSPVEGEAPPGFWESIRAGFGSVFGFLGSAATSLFGGITRGAMALLSGLGSVIGAIASGIGTAIGPILGAIGGAFGAAFAAGGPVPERQLARVATGELVVGPETARGARPLLDLLNRAAAAPAALARMARGAGRAAVALIPGPSSDVDNRYAALPAGGYVLRAAAVRRYGAEWITRLLSGGADAVSALASASIPSAAGLLALPALPSAQLPRYAAGGAVPYMPERAPGAAERRGPLPLSVVVPDRRTAERWYAGGEGALAEELYRRQQLYQRAMLAGGPFEF